MTPLHHAVAHGNVEMARRLYAVEPSAMLATAGAAADAELRNLTPTDLALRSKDTAMMAALGVSVEDDSLSTGRTYVAALCFCAECA